MARVEGLSQWTACVSTNLPHLTKPQATVLALWSYGIAMTRSCGRGTVATFLALLVGGTVAAVEQRLYEWCIAAPSKAGLHRTELDVTTCFAPLLHWIVRLWSGTQLALAIDATSLGSRFTVLAISVVYRGSGIPVAWAILPGTQPATWQPHWEALLGHIHGAIPAAWTVVVLADRGLYAQWLFQAIVAHGWHPLLRIKQGCTFRPHGSAAFVRLPTLVAAVGQRWRGRGTAFGTKGCQLDCTLVAWWGTGHAEPWFILTDLAPEGGDAQWYGLRGWCEQGFKVSKRGAWQWQQTQMTDPTRAARLWLALAVATLWMTSVGSDQEDRPPTLADALPDFRRLLGVAGTPPRRLRLVRLGWLWLLVQAIHGHPIPLPQRLMPEPWPAIPKRISECLWHQSTMGYAWM
jgi:hypothetical protein